MRIHILGVLFLLLATLSVIPFAFSQRTPASQGPHVNQTNGPAPLLVDAPMTKDQIAIRLADVVPITLEVSGGKRLEVKAPEKTSISPGWRLIEASPARTRAEGDKTQWQQTFTFEPLVTGHLTLAIEPLLVRDGGADFRRLAWKPLSVLVSTNIISPSLNDLRDPTVIESLQPPSEPESVPWLAIGAGGLAVALATLVFIRLRRRVKPRAASSQQRALRELERLLALDLPTKGMGEKFPTLLTKIVRRYLDAHWQLPTRRRTTRELLELVQSTGKLTEADQAFLREFFERCDLSKFARAEVSPEECLELAERTKDFLHAQTEADAQTNG